MRWFVLHVHKRTGSIHVRFAKCRKQNPISPKDTTIDGRINITGAAKTAKYALDATNTSLTSGRFRLMHGNAFLALYRTRTSGVLSANQVYLPLLSVGTNPAKTELDGLAAKIATFAVRAKRKVRLTQL